MNILLIDNDEKIFYKKKDLKNITKNYNNYYEVESNKLKRKTSDNTNDINKKSKISNNNFIL